MPRLKFLSSFDAEDEHVPAFARGPIPPQKGDPMAPQTGPTPRNRTLGTLSAVALVIAIAVAARVHGEVVGTNGFRTMIDDAVARNARGDERPLQRRRGSRLRSHDDPTPPRCDRHGARGAPLRKGRAAEAARPGDHRRPAAGDRGHAPRPWRRAALRHPGSDAGSAGLRQPSGALT